jgi:hypothetical protein
MALVRWVGRAIGLDVHRDFCVVAICEDGRVRSAGRVPSTSEGSRLLAESLSVSPRSHPGARREAEREPPLYPRSPKAHDVWPMLAVEQKLGRG